MKRNRFFVLGVLAMVLAFGLVLAGCDNGSTGGGDAFTWPTGLGGTAWESDDDPDADYSFVGDSDGDYLDFYNTSVLDVSYKDVTAIGTLTATAGKFKAGKMEIPGVGTQTTDTYFEYSISGNSMTLKEATTEAGLAAATPDTYTKQ